MKRYKGSSGWFNESHRHSLAAQGIKTGRKDYACVNDYAKKSLRGKSDFVWKVPDGSWKWEAMRYEGNGIFYGKVTSPYVPQGEYGTWYVWDVEQNGGVLVKGDAQKYQDIKKSSAKAQKLQQSIMNFAKRELRDELEVPGHVMMYKMVTKEDAIKRLKEIMDDWESKGYNKPNDVPENEEKEEYRSLLRSLGLKVDFAGMMCLPQDAEYQISERVKELKKEKEIVRGGYGDYKPDSDFDPVQLKKGIKVEMEHTDNPKIAKEIAKDHLTEFKNYYIELEKMEKKLKKSKKKDYAKDKVYDSVYPEWEGEKHEGRPKEYSIDYQEEVLYQPTTIQLPQAPTEVDIYDQEKRREQEEKIRQAGIRTRQAIASGARDVAHGAGVAAKGIVSTIVEGLKWEPDEDEPKVPPGVMGMGRRRDTLSWSKKATLDEPDHPVGMKYPSYSKKSFLKTSKKSLKGFYKHGYLGYLNIDKKGLHFKPLKKGESK